MSFLKMFIFFLDGLEELTYHKEHKNSENNDKAPVTETSQPKVFGFKPDWVLIRDCTTPTTLKNRCI